MLARMERDAEYWISEVNHHNPGVPIIMILSKSDLLTTHTADEVEMVRSKVHEDAWWCPPT